MEGELKEVDRINIYRCSSDEGVNAFEQLNINIFHGSSVYTGWLTCDADDLALKVKYDTVDSDEIPIPDYLQTRWNTTDRFVPTPTEFSGSYDDIDDHDSLGQCVHR